MLEHVARKYYKTYFKKIYDILKPDGKALIHTIGSIDKPRDPQSWITTFYSIWLLTIIKPANAPMKTQN